MDELENFTLKTFKRPLRPAALRKATFRSRRSENSSTESEKVLERSKKVPKNGHEAEAACDTNGASKEIHDKVDLDSSYTDSYSVLDGDFKVTKNGELSSSQFPAKSSVYRQKHREQINEVRQPAGFDASLASQVVTRAQKFGKKFNFLQKEEVFGSD